MSELKELLEEIETAIKEYSEELVQQLSLRDELEFAKELENSFISALIEVQNKQKEHKETAKKKKKLKNGPSQNGRNERSHMPGTVSDVSRKHLMLFTGSRSTAGQLWVWQVTPVHPWGSVRTCFLSSSTKVFLSDAYLLWSLDTSAPQCAGGQSMEEEKEQDDAFKQRTGQWSLIITSE